MESLGRKLMFIAACVLLAAFALGSPATASADPLGVSYTLSGGPGAWTLDFSVTNNITGAPNQDLYLFGVQVDNSSISAFPSAFVAFPSGINPFATWGGANIAYNDVWTADVGAAAGFPGQTISGFDVTITSAAAPTSVEWLGWSFDVNDQPSYTAGGNFNNTGSQAFNAPYNPGFEGLATGTYASSQVPEPASFSMLAAGLIVLVGLRKVTA